MMTITAIRAFSREAAAIARRNGKQPFTVEQEDIEAPLFITRGLPTG